MFSYVFGDDTTDDGSGATPDQEAAAQQFIPLGEQLQAAEATLRSAFADLAILANNAGDPTFQTIPVDMITAYNTAQQQLVVTCQVYIDAQSQVDGTTYTPNPPPLIVQGQTDTTSSGFGAAFMSTRVAPASLMVVTGPPGAQTSTPLAGPGALALAYMHADTLRYNPNKHRSPGLGFPLVALFVLIGVALFFTALLVMTSMITGASNTAHISNVQLATQQSNQVKSATSAGVAMQQQCIASGGNGIACTQAAGAASSQIVKSLPTLPGGPRPPSSAWSVWETIGIISAVAVTSIVGFAVYKKYKRRGSDRHDSELYSTRAYPQGI